MRPKYKVTGCARFFFFLIIFIPIVYFGAAYIRGENGMEKLKGYYHKVIGKKEEASPNQNLYSPTERIQVLERELKMANEKIRELEDKIKAQETEIKSLKQGG